MYKKFNAIKDTLIDENRFYSSSNFGRDELLEVGRTVVSGSVNRIRSLIKFDMTSISASVSDGTVSSSATWELKVFECRHTGSIPDDFYLDAHAITSVWNEGTGSRAGSHKSGYASWHSASSTVAWTSLGADYSSSNSASQYFVTGSGDITMNVSTIVSGTVYSGWNNEGFLIKTKDDVTSASMEPKKFYSRDTHTIYEPVLVAKWDDSTTTGSLAGISVFKNYVFSLVAPKEEYNVNEKPYFEIYIREAYPTLSWGTGAAEITSTPLDNLYYQFEDVETKDQLIPFSSQSKVSYNALTNKNFFYSYMDSLNPNRTYKLTIRHDFSGSKEYYTVHNFRTID